MIRKVGVWAALVLALAVSVTPARTLADDASAGYARIKPALVKIWSIDAQGRPTDSGSGFIIASTSYASIVLTSLHVVSTAARINIDINRNIHDVSATIVSRDRTWDIALLKMSRGNFKAVTFASEQRSLSVGNIFAVAGFFKLDDQIGFAGQESQLLYPGTASSLSHDGKLVELANVELEKGLSGSPLFDPASGDVVGMVESSHSNGAGGYAVTNTLLIPFLASQRPVIAFARSEPPKPAPRPIVPTVPPRSSTPAPPDSSSRSRIVATEPRANGILTPEAILANPSFYDGKGVRVTGTVRNVKHRQSASGNDYVTLDLCGTSCIHVFAFGSPGLTAGRQIVVRGTFSAVRHTGAYTFYNELEADEDAL